MPPRPTTDFLKPPFPSGSSSASYRWRQPFTTEFRSSSGQSVLLLADSCRAPSEFHSSVGQSVLLLADSCRAPSDDASAPDSGAAPGVGFKALADAMSDGKVFATICSDDVSAQMTQLGQMVLTAMGH